MKNDYRIGVIEADIDSAVDAEKVAETGVKVIQMHTGGACHITCQMSYEALKALGYDDLDVVILENVGNLVCPADFPLGTDYRVVVISTTEGDDMVRKHPDIFIHSDLAILNKVDIADAVDVDPEVIVKDYEKLTGGKKRMIKASVKKGIGIDEILKELNLE